MTELKYLIEKEGPILPPQQRIQEGIDDFVDAAMKRAASENRFSLPSIYTFLSYPMEQVHEPGFPVIGYLKNRATCFITSLLLSEMVLIKDCQDHNLALSKDILLFYEDLHRGKKEKIDAEQVSAEADQGPSFDKKAAALSDYIMEYANASSENVTEEDGFFFAGPGSILSKVHQTFSGSFTSEFFENSLVFLPMQLEDNDINLPVSFFPYIGTVISWSIEGDEFLFSKTRKQLNKYKDSLSIKDGRRNFTYMTGAHKRYRSDADVILYAARKSRPSVVVANRFLFDQILHEEFFGSLNCRLFNEISRRIDLLELKDMKRKTRSRTPFTHIETSESLFFLRLLEILMLFDVGLKEIEELQLYSNDIIMTGKDNCSHTLYTNFQIEIDAIDSSIAFSYSMRFLYSFFEIIRTGMADLISEIFMFLEEECTDCDVLNVLDELASSERIKHHEATALETDFEKHQFLLITYLLNKGSLGLSFE